MNTRFIISCVVFLFLTGSLYAESESSDVVLGEQWLGKITVKKTSVYSQGTVSITDGDINQTSSNDISQALSRSGSHLYVTSDARGEHLFRLRGFDQKEAVVLFDGVPIYVPFDGTVDLGAFGVQGVGNIDISPGLTSILYGPNALAGAVNIESKVADEPFKLDTWGEFGEYQTWDSGVSVSSKQKKGYFSLNAQGWDSNGFELSSSFKPERNESGGRRLNSYKQGGMVSGVLGLTSAENLETALRVVYLDRKQGIPPDTVSTSPRYWRWADWKKENYSLMGKIKAGDQFYLKTNFFYDAYHNVLDSFTDDTFSTFASQYPHSTYDDYSLGAQFYPVVSLHENGELNFLVSTKYDNHRSQDTWNDAWKVFSATTYGLGGEYTRHLTSRLSFVSGLIYEYFDPEKANGADEKPKIDILNPQAGLSYDLGENALVSFKLGQQSRFPTLKDLYSDRLGNYRPNPDLKAEKAMHYEAAYSKKFSNENGLKVNLFRSDVRDLIDRVVDTTGGYKYQMRNINKSVLEGVELDADLHLGSRFLFQPFYHYLYAKNVSQGRSSDNLEYRPAYITGFNTSYRMGEDFFAYFELKYVSWQKYRDANIKTYDAWDTLPGYAVVNLKLEKKIHDLSVWFRVENLLDKNYETERGFPEEGRTFFLGLRYDFQ